MDIKTAVTKFGEFLNKELVDPLSKRSSAWIYDDEVRIDLDKTPYPKILLRVEDSDVNKERLGIGEISTIDTIALSIIIKAKLGEHYGVGEDNYTGKEFVGYLGNEVEKLIKESHDEFIDLGFSHIIPIKTRYSKDQEKNPLFTLTCEMKFIN